MKVAVLVIGQLRFRNREHLIDFKNKIDDLIHLYLHIINMLLN